MLSRTVLIAVLLSVTPIILLTGLGLPDGHSVAFNLAWTTQYSETLTWASPLPRYLPGLWAGFGGHDFFFYAPLPFWLIAVLVDPLCPGCAPSTEFVLGSAVMLVASGFSMFAFLRAFFARQPALFGAVVYAVLPYHLLLDWFARQAAGEFAAYAFIPLAALGIERIRRNEHGGWLLALGVAGVTLSHLPTTLLLGHAFGLLILVFAVLAPGSATGRARMFARFAGFGILGLALASFYWLPAVMLLDTVSPKALFDPYFEAWRWLYGPGQSQPNTTFAFVVLASFLACLPFLLGSVFGARGPVLFWILIPAAFAVFMNSSLSEPIWRVWIIAKVQFPWRLMTVIDFSTAIAAAVLVAGLSRRIGRLIFFGAVLVAVLPFAFLVETVRPKLPDAPPEQTYIAWFAASEYLSPEMTAVVAKRLGKTEMDHFDQYAMADAVADMAAEFDADQAGLTILDQGPRSLTVLAPKGGEPLSLPVQYWFLWQARTAAGEALDLRANPRFGTIDILAPDGGFDEGPVTLSLPFHTSEQVGGAVSLVALAALMILSRRRRHGKT